MIDLIKSLKTKNKKAKNSKEDVLKYYEEHEDKMLYKTYKELGYMIGSGPIESAHQSVIQQRKKLVGQRWLIDGEMCIRDRYLGEYLLFFPFVC